MRQIKERYSDVEKRAKRLGNRKDYVAGENQENKTKTGDGKERSREGDKSE